MEATQTETPVRIGKNSEWIVPAAVVTMVFVMLVPIPAILLDILLALSITAAVLVLLISMYIERPVQFSVFPSLLLLLTLFRLSLNMVSSRRILLHGSEGAAAAGHVIEAFGQFVIGGNYVVGFVIFLALIAIQYLVVNHGAVRIAEVSARFTLDALPGKQMAIDADLSAGLINEEQARSRRLQVGREAEFYGAMDGAARFSQRDALATILITAINIGAGFLIGVFQQGVPFAEALQTYTILTVGDGLVTMVPSLLVSVAGGMVATRASSEAMLGTELGHQLLRRSRPLWIVMSVMLVLATVPGMPKFSFLLTAAGIYWIARRASIAERQPATQALKELPKKTETAEMMPPLDELSLEIGNGLVSIVDEARSGQLLQRVRALRRHLATQLGFMIPSIHITDNPRLNPQEYILKLRGTELAKWQLYQDYLLAVSSEATPPAIDGIETREPAFNVPARWIPKEGRERALAAGYAVVDQTSVIATHIAEVIRQNAHELLTRQETKRLLDGLSETQPKLVEELVPKLLSLGEVQRVMQQILKEQVSIRDLSTILETMIDVGASNKNVVALVEAVRQALGRSFVRPLVADDGKLKVIQVDAEIEEKIAHLFDSQTGGAKRGIEVSVLRKVVDGLRNLVGEQMDVVSPILLCNSPARFHLRRALEPFLPKLVVLSPAEIPGPIHIQSIGVLHE